MREMHRHLQSYHLHDIMDSETFLGLSVAPHLGVDNPLTALSMFSDFSGSDGDGTERASDIDIEEGRVREMHRQLHTIVCFARSHIIASIIPSFSACNIEKLGIGTRNEAIPLPQQATRVHPSIGRVVL